MQQQVVYIKQEETQYPIHKSTDHVGLQRQNIQQSNQSTSYYGLDQRIFDISYEISSYGQSLIDSNTILFITGTVVDPKFPTFVRLIINIFINLVRCFSNKKQNHNLAKQLEEQPQKISIKQSVWKIILAIIQKKLYNCETLGYYLQLSTMIIFRRQIFGTFFYMISQPQTYIKISSFLKFYHSLEALQNCLPMHIYYLLGGEKILSYHNFKLNIEFLVNFLSKYLNADNIVIEYVKSITEKKKDKDNQTLQKYIYIVSDFRKAASTDYLANIIRCIFKNDQTIVSKQIFTERVKALNANQQNKFQSNLLTKLFQLIKLQFYIVQTQKFKQFALKDKSEMQDNKSKYYLNTLEKLINKCPYNGDDKCNCKKCQCVRRNRASAKQSQQKKRDAVQQIGPLYERVKQLELKNYELENENLYLKSIISNFYQHPNFYTIIKQNMEPLVKSLDNYQDY